MLLFPRNTVLTAFLPEKAPVQRFQLVESDGRRIRYLTMMPRPGTGVLHLRSEDAIQCCTGVF